MSPFAGTLGVPSADVDAFLVSARGLGFAAHPSFRDAFLRHGPGWPWWTGVLRDDRGRILAALAGAVEHRFGGAWLRLAPFGAPAGPAFDPSLDEDARLDAARALWEGLGRHVRDLGYLGGDLTFTRPAAIEPALRPGVSVGVERTDHAHVIDAGKGYDAWRASLRKRARQQLTKAERLGVSAGVDGSADALDTVYALHLDQARAWGVRDVRPRGFYRALLDAPGDAARLWVARAEGQVVCGVLVLLAGEEAYVWWSGSGAEARRRLAFPYLLSTVVAGCGRARVSLGFSGGRDNLTDFKEQMGAASVPVPVLELTPRPRTPYHALLAYARGVARRRKVALAPPAPAEPEAPGGEEDAP